MTSPAWEPCAPFNPLAPGSSEEASEARDRLLLDQVHAGDQAALQALVSAYWSPLVRYAARIMDGIDSAEDAVQEAFVRLWERRAGWQPRRSARVLLYTMVRHLALNRRTSVATRSRLLTLHSQRMERSPASPLELVEGLDVERAIERAIEALPPRRREVLVLSRYHDLSRTEIAELLALSAQTVSNHLTLAITELRRSLRFHLPSHD